MTPRPTPLRGLEGPGSADRARRLRQRFRQAEKPVGRGVLARLGARLLFVYWISCLTVIALGLDTLYPEVRPALVARVEALAAPERAPSPDLTRPFPNCAAAHAAGVYDIPAGSPAYSPRQDGDGDGFACEPY